MRDRLLPVSRCLLLRRHTFHHPITRNHHRHLHQLARPRHKTRRRSGRLRCVTTSVGPSPQKMPSRMYQDPKWRQSLSKSLPRWRALAASRPSIGSHTRYPSSLSFKRETVLRLRPFLFLLTRNLQPWLLTLLVNLLWITHHENANRASSRNQMTFRPSLLGEAIKILLVDWPIVSRLHLPKSVRRCKIPNP